MKASHMPQSGTENATRRRNRRAEKGTFKAQHEGLSMNQQDTPLYILAVFHPRSIDQLFEPFIESPWYM